MKKMIMALVCALTFTNIISAQQFTNVIVANGGTFEFSPPYQDFVTIGAYDEVQKKYWVFDTIDAQSVQDLVIDTNIAYLGAESHIVKYDLTTYERIGEATYAGVLGSLSLHDTLLFVSRYYGAGAYLSVYDARNLSLMYEVSEIDQSVKDVVVVGDTAYVPYNQKGTVDQWPPYGVYNDTIGKIGVIDLVNQTFVRDIVLDTIGAGATEAFMYDSVVYVVCSVNGAIAKLDARNASLDFDTVAASGGIAMVDSVLYASYNYSVGAYDVLNGNMLTTGIASGYFAATALDTLNNRVAYTLTDYSSYGKTYLYTTNGAYVDSFDVNVSPQAMAINYKSGNFGPIALNDYVEAMEDSTNGITANILNTDFDPNGDVLTVSVLTNALHGTATLVNDSIHYVPTAGYSGLDSVEYKICDGSLCDSAYLVINVVHISGVQEVLTLSKLTIYPNPVVDEFVVETNMAGNKQLVIFDVKGQISHSESFLGNNTRVSVSALSKGAYIVKITNGSVVELSKLLKN